MKTKQGELFAIYKNEEHKGNERGISENDAIRNYIIASLLENFIEDEKFISQYSAKTAIKGIHFEEYAFS
jgi:hypothetical protein